MSTTPPAPHTLPAWSDAALAALLVARPDLASPLPGTLTALASRAATARSVQLAVSGLDSPHLAVLDAVLALTALRGEAREEDVATATGLTDVSSPLAALAALALVVPDGDPSRGRWAPGAGVAAARPRPANLAVTVPGELTDPDAVTAAADGLTAAARRVLDALTWGPPVGTFGGTDGPASAAGAASADATASGTAAAVAELLAGSLVRSTGDGGVVLPGSTALVLRAGRTHRDLTPEAPALPAPAIAVDVRTAESARAALELHQHLLDLLDLWGTSPAGALRSGGIGVREIRRTAVALGAPEPTVTVLVELAAAAGEIGGAHDDDGALWAPTHVHDGEEPARRWARLATTWLAGDRAFALVGTRADDGALRSVLEPGLERGWAARLRRRVLEALRAWPAGSAPDLPAVLAHLGWHTPASPPPDWAVQAVLAEAALLGVTAAGALSPAGEVLLDARADAPTDAETDADEAAVLDVLASTLEAGLPDAVEEILLQADLTAIVPGRPTREIEELLVRTSEIESRGSGLTTRFTTASLSRAVEQGLRAEELLAALREASRTPVPQALEYAVRDAERRHGGLRAGPATSYLRSDDPAVLAALVHERDLGLRLLAPTVAVSGAPAARIAALLRERGQAVLVEGPDGVVVTAAAGTVAAAPRRARVTTTATSELADPAAAVRRLRTAEEAATSGAGPQDPGGGVALLREAARAQSAVWVTVVGPSGAVDRRRVAPVRVQGGQVVARDLDRESDLTIALHRIADVAPA